MYKKRFEEIAARKLEIRAMLEGGENVDLEKIQEELRALEAEDKQLRARIQVMEALKGSQEQGSQGAQGQVRKVDQTGEVENREAKAKEHAEKRGKDLKELRSVTVGASNIVMAEHKATDIKPTFNQVSSLIDRVHIRTLLGGESYTQPYLVGYGEGGYTTEGNDYTTAEPQFAYAAMTKAKVTAYAEDSEETLKLPSADYDGVVMGGIRVATRKKITKEILIGGGAANQLIGIFSVAATAIDAATDLGIAAIDATTLDNIIYSFGGDEDVEDTAVLILSKKDLKAFATLRNADGKKVYDVKNNGNTGTIDGVPYIINSACKAVVDAGTVAGQYCMAYGPLSNYTLAIFSDLDVQRSTDYKFKQGMIAHRGSIFAGGNVTAKNGFLRVKKA